MQSILCMKQRRSIGRADVRLVLSLNKRDASAPPLHAVLLDYDYSLNPACSSSSQKLRIRLAHHLGGIYGQRAT